MKNDMIDETSDTIVDELSGSNTDETLTGSYNVTSGSGIFCCPVCGTQKPRDKRFCSQCGFDTFSVRAAGRTAQKTAAKTGKDRSAAAFLLILAVYLTLVFNPELFFLCLLTLGTAAFIFAVSTLRNSSSGKILSVIVIILYVLPVVFLFAILVMTIGWFIFHPGWEP